MNSQRLFGSIVVLLAGAVSITVVWSAILSQFHIDRLSNKSVTDLQVFSHGTRPVFPDPSKYPFLAEWKERAARDSELIERLRLGHKLDGDKLISEEFFCKKEAYWSFQYVLASKLESIRLAEQNNVFNRYVQLLDYADHNPEMMRYSDIRESINTRIENLRKRNDYLLDQTTDIQDRFVTASNMRRAWAVAELEFKVYSTRVKQPMDSGHRNPSPSSP